MVFGRDKTELVGREQALSGRAEPVPVADRHVVLGTPLQGPWPGGHEVIYFAMGCFWGAERIFWQLDGVHSTAVGYMGGWTQNPTYEETCTSRTGHTETVQVVYDPAVVDIEVLLKEFWENHDPTTPNRQGNDVGTQYRSGIYVHDDAQSQAAQASLEAYQSVLAEAGLGGITTEILDAPAFYFAEGEHQQYLSKNPAGYCGLGGTGVACPVGLARST